MSSRWMGDTAVVWTIVLTARMEQAPSYDDVRARLVSLNEDLAGVRTGTVLRGDDVAVLRRMLARDPAGPVGVGISGCDLVISAHHEFLDGLGLLAALGALTGVEATSAARGLGERAERAGSWATRLQRLREVALTPPDRVPAVGGTPGSTVDTFEDATIARAVHGSELVHAAVRGVGTFSARHGVRPRRPVVAVGAARVDGSVPRLGDHSALLRLTELAGADTEKVRGQLRTAAPEAAAATGGDSHPLVGAIAGAAMRVLAPRLGSTLLVSHLGQVTAPGVAQLTFHPVTGGGSGVSLGAVTVGGVTTLTARGRGARHGDAALRELLHDTVSALGSAQG